MERVDEIFSSKFTNWTLAQTVILAVPRMMTYMFIEIILKKQTVYLQVYNFVSCIDLRIYK